MTSHGVSTEDDSSAWYTCGYAVCDKLLYKSVDAKTLSKRHSPKPKLTIRQVAVDIGARTHPTLTVCYTSSTMHYSNTSNGRRHQARCSLAPNSLSQDMEFLVLHTLLVQGRSLQAESMRIKASHAKAPRFNTCSTLHACTLQWATKTHL